MASYTCVVSYPLVPFPPNNLTVDYPGMARNSTTLVVTWDRPSCDRGVLSGYELCYIQTSSVGDCVSNGMIVNITGPDTLYYTINDLSINTNYTVEVRGRTGAGLGEPVTDVGTTDEDGNFNMNCISELNLFLKQLHITAICICIVLYVECGQICWLILTFSLFSRIACQPYEKR